MNVYQVKKGYHAEDCCCSWCQGAKPTNVDENGICYAEWIGSPPIIFVYAIHCDQQLLIDAGVLIEQVKIVDPYPAQEEEHCNVTRLTFPSGTKLGLQGGWYHLQLPNHLEVEHELRFSYDWVDGRISASPVIKVVPDWRCRWEDSSNRAPQQEAQIESADEHPF